MNTLPQPLDTAPAPYPLPDGWRWVRLGEVGQWGSGGTPSRLIADYFGGSIPWIKTGELNDETIVETEETITEKGILNSSAKIFPKGSIGIAMYGATIGKTGIFGIDASCNQAVAVLQPNNNLVLSQFIFQYLRSQRDNFTAQGKGGAQPNISQTLIKEYPIPLPPLAEQERIATRLDALLSKLREAKRLIAEARESFTLRRAALLHKAFTGALTADWRTEHPQPASEDASTDDDTPYDVPESWRWVKLGEVGAIQRGKSKHRPRNDERLFGGKYPFIQTGDIANSNDFILAHTQTLSEFGIKQSKLFEKGTICITIAANIGKTAMLTYPCCFPDSVVGFTANVSSAVSTFILYYLQSIQQSIEEAAPATAQKNINVQILDAIPLPLPPLAEQQEIVRRVEAVLAREQAASDLLALDEQIGVMEKAVLARAFRGEL